MYHALTANPERDLRALMIRALSRLQMEPQRYGAYYHRGILLSAATGMPLSAHGFAWHAASGFYFGLVYIGIWSMLPGGRRTQRSLLELIHYIR